MNSRKLRRAAQRGAALAVGLVILLIMTLLAVGALRTSMLEERITANVQESQATLAAAEAALRDGERFVQQPVLPAFDGSVAGLYGVPDPVATPRWTSIDWDSARAVIRSAAFDDAPAPLNRIAVKYFIELLPAVAAVSESLDAGAPRAPSAFYRVTARALGAGGTATVVLQSTFERPAP